MYNGKQNQTSHFTYYTALFLHTVPLKMLQIPIHVGCSHRIESIPELTYGINHARGVQIFHECKCGYTEHLKFELSSWGILCQIRTLSDLIVTDFQDARYTDLVIVMRNSQN